MLNPGVAQLVARVVWDHQAAGSNPVTRTINKRLWNVDSEVFLFFNNSLDKKPTKMELKNMSVFLLKNRAKGFYLKQYKTESEKTIEFIIILIFALGLLSRYVII